MTITLGKGKFKGVTMMEARYYQRKNGPPSVTEIKWKITHFKLGLLNPNVTIRLINCIKIYLTELK